MTLSPLEASPLHIHHDTPAAYEVEGYVGSWQEEAPFEKAAPPSCRSFLPLFHILPYLLPPIYLITYLPESFMCILSMTIGYLGLRYIELSISSPIQNSSGVVTALLIFFFFVHTLSWMEILAIVTITMGILTLALEEKKEADLLPLSPQEKNKYALDFLPSCFPSSTAS